MRPAVAEASFRRHIGLALAACLAATGCASVSPERGHQEVAALVEQRIGRKTSWDNGTPEDAAVAARVDALLGAGLTRERAVEIALVNNPSLQATYEELGVSQADMVQAGLLPNPSLGGSVGFPVIGGRIEYESSLVQSFLDILVLPLRKRVAREQFAADTLRVAHQALDVAAEVSKAFTDVQASARFVELRRKMLQAEQLSADLAQRRHAAGNITDLALAAEQARCEQAKTELAREELDDARRREALNRILGLWGPRTGWSIAEQLPEPPRDEAPLDDLEALAIRRRLDVDAARKQALLMSNAVGLARASRLFGVIEVGVHAHQDPDGPRLFGPTLSLELPIFDQRQALIARLEAQQRQADRRLAALSVDTRSQVRLARLELLTARQLAEHQRAVVLPLHEKIVAEAQRQYDGMQIGLEELLGAKTEQLETQRAHVEALGAYWMARAELERVVGGTIGKEEHHEQSRQ